MILCKCGCGAEVSEGKEFLPGHYAKWKAAQLKPVQELTNRTETLDNLESPLSRWQRLKKWWDGKPEKKFPQKLLSTEKIKEMKMQNSTTELTDQQKFIRFFSNLPKWTANKPGKITKWLTQQRTGNKFDIKHIVFVADNGDHKQAYLPFNSALNVFFDGDAYYDAPMNTVEPIFLDKERFAPLINRKNYKDDFDLPEDFASSLINTGISYGRLSQFKELIAKINQAISIQALAYITIIVMAIAIIVITYIQNKHYVAVEQQLANLTVVVRGGT